MGRGKIRVAELLFCCEVFFCCGRGLPSPCFLQKLLVGKKVRFFAAKKKLGPRCVAEIICKTSVQVKASSGGIYKCIHGPRVTWSKGLSVVYGAGAKWDLKVDEMWHTRTNMEKLWKQVRKSCTYVYIDCIYIYTVNIYICTQYTHVYESERAFELRNNFCECVFQSLYGNSVLKEMVKGCKR